MRDLKENPWDQEKKERKKEEENNESWLIKSEWMR